MNGDPYFQHMFFASSAQIVDMASHIAETYTKRDIIVTAHNTSSSSFWDATTSEKFWPSQRVPSIWSGLWCSPSSLLFSLLYHALHHPPIYFLVFLAILLVRVTTRILFFTMLAYDVHVRTKRIFVLWCGLWCFYYQSVCLVLHSI